MSFCGVGHCGTDSSDLLDEGSDQEMNNRGAIRALPFHGRQKEIAQEMGLSEQVLSN